MPGISEHEHHVRLSLASIDTTIKAMAAAAQQQVANRAVLACETWQFDANGLIDLSWHVPYQCVAVDARGTTKAVTVTSSPPQGEAPTTGVGVAVIAAGKAAVANLAGRALCLYGNPGETVTIQVFAAAQPPAWGS